MRSERNETAVRALTGVGIVAAIVGALWMGPWAWWTFLLVLAYIGGQEAKRLFALAWPDAPVMGQHVASRLVVGIPFAALAVMGWWEGTFVSAIPLGWFVLLWTNDTAAYIVGRQWGRHKMAPSISPGKSWEGWAGGSLGTLLVAYFVLGSAWEGSVLSAPLWLGLGVMVSVFGPMGIRARSLRRRAARGDALRRGGTSGSCTNDA